MPDTLTREVELIHTRALEGDAGAAQAFASAFDFLQRNADGRYSDRTLMTVNRLATRSEDVRNGEMAERYPTPGVCSLAVAIEYDEETEVKRGGLRAVAVALPAEWGSRLVIATARDVRGNGHARQLVDDMRCNYSNLHAWVGNTNIVGQQFLLSLGAFPVAMNSNRAIMFSWTYPDEDEGVAR